VGVVEQVGEWVEKIRVGMRVVVPHHVACGECPLCRRGNETLCPRFRVNLLHWGGFGERIIVRERAARMAARIVPDPVSDEAAVFLEPAACVLRGIQRAGLPSGEAGPPRAVVLGAGSMGLLHVLVLRAVYPGAKIMIVDPVADRLRLAEHLGADVALEPPRAISGFQADAVFDTVGGAARLEDSLAFLREGGTAVLFAHAPAGERAGFDLNALFKSEKRVVGTYSGSLREQGEVFDLIASGRLDASPLVTHRLPLSAFDEGLALVRERKALKVLFTPSAGSDS
jgi:L-iditol 2-dehydrogenase